jgi:hypothetical protein
LRHHEDCSQHNENCQGPGKDQRSGSKGADVPEMADKKAEKSRFKVIWKEKEHITSQAKGQSN